MVRTGMPTGGRAANSNAPILEKNVLGRCERCVKTPRHTGVLTPQVIMLWIAGDNTGLGNSGPAPRCFLPDGASNLRMACGTGRFFAKKRGAAPPLGETRGLPRRRNHGITRKRKKMEDP